MSKTSERRKHIPQRTCVVCRAIRPKRDLVRVVRTPENVIVIDETGKCSGRGAYLCRQRDCWDMESIKRQLERALRVTCTAEAVSELEAYAAKLPQRLTSPEKKYEQESEAT